MGGDAFFMYVLGYLNKVLLVLDNPSWYSSLGVFHHVLFYYVMPFVTTLGVTICFFECSERVV